MNLIKKLRAKRKKNMETIGNYLAKKEALKKFLAPVVKELVQEELNKTAENFNARLREGLSQTLTRVSENLP